MSGWYRNQKKTRVHSYILIGDGFDELEVIYFLHKFRRAGLSIKSVSLFNKLVISCQGVALKADFALAEKPFAPDCECLLILPAGGRNGDALRKDARVRSLLATMKLGYGRVVVTDAGSHLARDVEDLVATSTSLNQPTDQGISDFVDSLANQVEFAA